jgi:hypothetical protein
MNKFAGHHFHIQFETFVDLLAREPDKLSKNKN